MALLVRLGRGGWRTLVRRLEDVLLADFLSLARCRYSAQSAAAPVGACRCLFGYALGPRWTVAKKRFLEKNLRRLDEQGLSVASDDVAGRVGRGSPRHLCYRHEPGLQLPLISIHRNARARAITALRKERPQIPAMSHNE